MTEPSDRQPPTAATDTYLNADVASATGVQLIDSIDRGSHDALAKAYSR